MFIRCLFVELFRISFFHRGVAPIQSYFLTPKGSLCDGAGAKYSIALVPKLCLGTGLQVLFAKLSFDYNSVPKLSFGTSRKNRLKSQMMHNSYLSSEIWGTKIFYKDSTGQVEEWGLKIEEWRLKNEEWRMKNEEWRLSNCKL